MYYLIECPQSPVIARKRYEEFITLSESGASIQDQNKHIKESKLMSGGLPWRTVLFSIDKGMLKADPKGSYFELPGQASADCVKLFAHIDSSEGYYGAAKAKINYTEELTLSLIDPTRIDKLVHRIAQITEWSHGMELSTPSFHFPSTKWETLKKDVADIHDELNKLIHPRLVLDTEICKLVNHDEIRMEAYEAIHFTRELYDSIVHELNLVEAWCNTALNGLPGFQKSENFYIVRSDVGFH